MVTYVLAPLYFKYTYMYNIEIAKMNVALHF